MEWKEKRVICLFQIENYTSPTTERIFTKRNPSQLINDEPQQVLCWLKAKFAAAITLLFCVQITCYL